MDIVDAQIHLGPGRIDEALAAMDALGIRAALIDEYWVRSFAGEPRHDLPGNAYRAVAPTAELAGQLRPDRFSYLLRVHRDDPEYASLVRQMRDAPAARALRLEPGMSADLRKSFAEGGYDHILAAAADCGLPVFVFAPDDPGAFARAAAAFPGLRIVIDHCGIFSNSMRTGFAGLPARDDAAQRALFGEVLALARYRNLAFKWGHASAMFDSPAWPGEGLWPRLREAVDAFGPGRVMWASDYSVNQRGESWAQLLFGVLGAQGFTQAELGEVLGGAVRRLLDWPA